MLTWLSQNLSTIIVLLVVIVVFVLIVAKMIIDKKKGKTSCSCGCNGCPMSDSCHSKDK